MSGLFVCYLITSGHMSNSPVIFLFFIFVLNIRFLSVIILGWMGPDSGFKFLLLHCTGVDPHFKSPCFACRSWTTSEAVQQCAANHTTHYHRSKQPPWLQQEILKTLLFWTLSKVLSVFIILLLVLDHWERVLEDFSGIKPSKDNTI